jgi:GNAT superfamily N-acetyltransferase
VTITYLWRGEFRNDELSALHADAFGVPVVDATPAEWRQRVSTHSIGWVVAMEVEALVGFVNVPWDGFAHAWLQDTMVASRARRSGVGRRLVTLAAEGARQGGCEWLHVDFDDRLRSFYFDACGFTPTNAGLIKLKN